VLLNPEGDLRPTHAEGNTGVLISP